MAKRIEFLNKITSIERDAVAGLEPNTPAFNIAMVEAAKREPKCRRAMSRCEERAQALANLLRHLDTTSYINSDRCVGCNTESATHEPGCVVEAAREALGMNR